MVDLAFLLITFFILTTTLAKPQSMKLNLPDKDDDPDPNVKTPEVPAWRTMTVVLGKDDKLLHYVGLTSKPEADGQPTVDVYGGKGIRKVLLKHKAFVESSVDDPKKEGQIILIKASKSANYKNVVDILDEMAITNPRSYAVVDITPEDLKLLQDKGIK
jgi:biopolymer transport protein ExbD